MPDSLVERVGHTLARVHLRVAWPVGWTTTAATRRAQ